MGWGELGWCDMVGGWESGLGGGIEMSGGKEGFVCGTRLLEESTLWARAVECEQCFEDYGGRWGCDLCLVKVR